MDIDEEKANIEQTLQYFFDGLDNLDPDTIKKAFYPDARSFYIDQDKLGINRVDHWDKTTQTAKDNPDHPFREKSRKNIVYIDITGVTASAKVEWVFSDFMFTDYYNMLKLDGRWYIMNKIYHTTEFVK